jgi:hypothetical protein
LPWKADSAFAPASNACLDFDELLYQSIISQNSANDNTEGYVFDPMPPTLHPVYLEHSLFSSPTPLTPPPQSPPPITTELIPQLSSNQPSPASIDMRSHGSGAGSNLATTSKTHPPSKGKQLIEAIYRKQKGKRREILKKQLQQAASHHGYYAAKPAAVSKHIKPAKPHRTLHISEDLPHVRTAYLGAWDKGGLKRVFRLGEVVGSGSKFGFDLKKWDGRCA